MFCAVCSRDAIVARKKQKAATMEAAISPPSNRVVNDPTPYEEIEEQTSPLHRTKRLRWSSGAIATYASRWGVLATDSIASRASAPAREVGPDLSRGLILPEDRSTYEKVDAVEACTKMLGLLSMISLFIPSHPTDFIFPLTYYICFFFRLFPGLLPSPKR